MFDELLKSDQLSEFIKLVNEIRAITAKSALDDDAKSVAFFFIGILDFYEESKHDARKTLDYAQSIGAILPLMVPGAVLIKATGELK